MTNRINKSNCSALVLELPHLKKTITLKAQSTRNKNLYIGHFLLYVFTKNQ